MDLEAGVCVCGKDRELGPVVELPDCLGRAATGMCHQRLGDDSS